MTVRNRHDRGTSDSQHIQNQHLDFNPDGGVNPASLFSFAIPAAAALASLLLVASPIFAQQQRLLLAGHVPAAVANSTMTGALASEQRLSLAIGLPLRNQAELDTLLAKIADPTSSHYRHYLTPDQFAARFGPAEADYQALIQFAENHGLTVTGIHPNRVVLDVAGDVSHVEGAFHVKMKSFRHPVRGTYYAPDRDPEIEADLPILDISGLDNFVLPRPMNLKANAVSDVNSYVTGSGPGGYFIGKDFRAAYAPGVTLTGSGQTVGLLEFDGFFAGDVAKNAAAAGVAAVPTQTVLLDGFSGAAGSANIEVILDIMMASYMAPNLSKVIVYEGYTPNDILNRMATDNQAQQLSSSWGYGPINATTEQIFKQYAAQGQSILQASGDSGAYKNGIMQPSDDPNLTVVGGTSLATAGASGPWQAETTWTGSGGGISTAYPLPSYQQGVSMAANGGSTKMRNIPDVALTADVQMFLIEGNGQAVVVGGTSAAAPLWAGFIALANQQAAAGGKARVGFLNPILYSLGAGSSFTSDFNDIRTGNNGGFSAVTGYDLATGWGSPAGQHLINDLTGVTTTTAPSFKLLSAASTLTIRQATTATNALTITGQNGFNGTVALAATGLPAGLMASFSPAQATNASTVTLTASNTAAAGTYPVTITGTSGTLSSSTTLAITITAPSFSLSASAATLTVPRAASGSSILTVAGQNGFNSTVALTAAGLPAGVTAAFSPSSTAGTSTLTIAASSSALAGTYPVTITGVSGALTSRVTISVSITVPDFSVTFAPTGLTISPGQIAPGSLTIVPQGGFQGAVTLTATGLPAGVTAGFGAATSSGVVTVTFTASSTAGAGTFPVVIHAASGSLTHTTPLTLTVSLPAAGTSFVNLAAAYNVNALVIDGAPFTGPGIDGGLNGSSTAYSANLVGARQTVGGVIFSFGPANALDAVSGRTIALPAGKYSALKLLATAVNGSQAAQTFKVTYTDGTSTTVSQGVSDWFVPANFPGESRAMTMPYRDNGAGQRDNRTFNLYEYSIALNTVNTVASVTLPNNRNVVVLAATLVSSSGAVAHIRQ
jgi:hypothetical protein